MTNEPNLETLLKAITNSLEDSVEKNIVELYLNDPASLSRKSKKQAAGMIKDYLSQYPELAPVYPKKEGFFQKTKKVVGNTLEVIMYKVIEHPLVPISVLGLGALTATGLYVGSYLAAAEISAGIGAVLPIMGNFMIPEVDKSKYNDTELTIGIVSGAILGTIGGLCAYGGIPDFAAGETANLLGKSMLAGIGAGIVGSLVMYARVYGDPDT